VPAWAGGYARVVEGVLVGEDHENGEDYHCEPHSCSSEIDLATLLGRLWLVCAENEGALDHRVRDFILLID
jgi:hypothetical protein